jgi:hypothetical protein
MNLWPFCGKAFTARKELGNSQVLYTPTGIFLLLGVYIGDISLRAKNVGQAREFG